MEKNEETLESKESKEKEFLSNLNYFVNYKNVLGETPIHKACRLGKLETVKILVQHGADVNIINNKGLSSLDIAMEEKNNEIIKFLLEEKKTIVEINTNDINGNNILHKCSDFNDRFSVEMMDKIFSKLKKN